MPKAFVVDVGIRLQRQAAQAGGGADDRLVELFPERFGPHERFVVKTCGQERRKQVADRHEVVFKGKSVVLARRGQSFEQFNDGRLGVRFPVRAASQLNESIGLFRPGAEHAARSMVLE